jgi:thymidylate synthase
MENKVDNTYCDLLRLILKDGKTKKNRTGVDTIGVFGAQAKFDVNLNAFPILTTKKIYTKAIIHELLWFLHGDTNIKYLVDNDVNIWNEWAYDKFKKDGFLGDHDFRNHILTQSQFIERIKKLPADDWFVEKFGDLGEGTYGSMWRAFPYFDPEKDIEKSIEDKFGDVDQIQKVIDKLKSNPDDRRMIVSAWHPYWVDHCALPPCHCLFHFNTEELTQDERLHLFYEKNGHLDFGPGGFKSDDWVFEWLNKSDIPKRKINVLLYQRSCDTFLGVPFNITSYSLLLAMVAHCVNMVPGTFTHTYGDLHIYSNHLSQVHEQLSRTPMSLPKLRLNPFKKDLMEFEYEDIMIEEYQSHPTIKAPIAI